MDAPRDTPAPARPAWLPAARILSRREWMIGCVIALVVAGIAVVGPERGATRAAVAAVFGCLLAYICVVSPREGMRAVLVWLAFLGLTRRLASEVLADPERDALIVVAPFAAGVLCLRSLLDGAWRARGRLANCVGLLAAVMLLQVFNPRQGDLLVGLVGLLVWFAPMLWFWIGRQYVDVRGAQRIVGLTGLVCVAGALYGLFQFTVDFPAWDQHWITERGYAALYIGPTTVRPFGFSASASEFAIVAAFGCLWSLLVFTRAWRHRAFGLAVVAFVSAAACGSVLALSAVRTVMVGFVLALAVVYLVGRRGRPWIPLAIGLVLVVLVAVAVRPIDVDSLPRDGSTASARRLVAFLQNPFSDNYEVTTDQHVDTAVSGIKSGFRHPLGRGTGSTNLAAERFGSDRGSRNHEVDIANASVAFGLAGLILVTAITIAVVVTAIRRARARRDLTHLAVLGLVLISVGNWWNGGHYFAAALVWLLIGWLDAPARERNGLPALTSPPARD